MRNFSTSITLRFSVEIGRHSEEKQRERERDRESCFKGCELLSLYCESMIFDQEKGIINGAKARN